MVTTPSIAQCGCLQSACDPNTFCGWLRPIGLSAYGQSEVAVFPVLSIAANAVNDTSTSTAQATLLGAIIAGTAALLTAMITVSIQRHSISRGEKFAFRQQSLQRTERQIDELYGPLILLRRQSKYLWTRLREGKADKDWRLLNHIDEVQADPAEYAIAQELVRLNELSQEIILKHPALIYNQVFPESFHKFLAHAGIVKVALQMGRVPGDGTFIYYPSEFDRDLEAAHAALLEVRARELEGKS